MSGLHLPPAEPPDEDLADLRDMIEAVREQLADAERQEHMLAVAIADNADTPTRRQLVTLAGYVMEHELAQQRVAFWRPIVATTEKTARDRGLSL